MATMMMVAMTVVIALAAVAGAGGDCGGGRGGGGGGNGNGNDNGSGGDSRHVSCVHCCVLFFYVIDCCLSSEYSLTLFSHSQSFSVAFSLLFTPVSVSCNAFAHLSHLLL